MADESPAAPVEEAVMADTSQPAEAAGAEDAEQDVDAEESDEQELSEEDVDELRANEVAFDWQASEYVQHHKGAGWYMMLVAVVVVLIAAAILLQYWLEIGAFIAMGVAIVVYAQRPPRTLTYELTPDGITVDGKDFPFTEFRSFGVISETDWHTIDLVPTKRFSPRMAVLFEDADFDPIVGHLELHLPRVDRDPDVVERLTRLARF